MFETNQRVRIRAMEASKLSNSGGQERLLGICF